MREQKQEALNMLRLIASSETLDGYNGNVEKLRESEIWNSDKAKAFRQWITNTWLPVHKVNLKFSKIFSFVH